VTFICLFSVEVTPPTKSAFFAMFCRFVRNHYRYQNYLIGLLLGYSPSNDYKIGYDFLNHSWVILRRAIWLLRDTFWDAFYLQAVTDRHCEMLFSSNFIATTIYFQKRSIYNFTFKALHFETRFTYNFTFKLLHFEMHFTYNLNFIIVHFEM